MQAPDPKYVLTLAADLMQAKNALAELQGRWDGLFSGEVVVVPDTPRKGGGRPPDADSLTSRIVAYLDAEPQYHYDINDLVKHFGVEKVQVERAVNRLTKAKRIARHSRGNYESIIQV